jgi:transposase InsO family protein
VVADHGQLEPGCIAHSERGSEYISEELRREANRLGMRQSMRCTGSRYDNAVESLLVLKEGIGTRSRPSRAAARATLFALIETCHGRKRLRKHPAWGYLTPLET